MPSPMPLKESIEFQTGAMRFTKLLTLRFGDDLWCDTPDETKELIANIQSFYSKVKNSHRGQERMTGEKYFNGHVLPVVDIVLSFPDATVRDAITALWHDFPEDDEEMTAAEALDWTQKTFGKKHGPHIRKSIENLTKFDLPDYLDGNLKEKFEKKTEEEQKEFLRANNIDLSEIRGEKYFANLEENGSNGDLRVKAADSIHNLMSCHTLWSKKIEKTISEKEIYLLPLLKKREMTAEANAVERCLSITKLVGLKQRISQEQFAILKGLTHPGTSKAIIALFQTRE